MFSSQQRLRQHVMVMHARPNVQPTERITCELCDFATNNNQEFLNHKRDCNAEFRRVGSNKICRYFLNGGCIKADQCRFSHPYEKQFRSAPICRNGPQCRYLAGGICRYFHRGFGIQQPANEQQNSQESYQNNAFKQPNNSWCKYQENCFRLPNCAFNHYDEDFPKLSNYQNPPIREKIWAWRDY